MTWVFIALCVLAIATGIIALFFSRTSSFPNNSAKAVADAAIKQGRMEGFNLAFFSVQDIILQAFATRGWEGEKGYDTLKEIMIESDNVIRDFYPGIQFPSIEEALKKAEQDLLSGKKFSFPNSGNNTLN